MEKQIKVTMGNQDKMNWTKRLGKRYSRLVALSFLSMVVCSFLSWAYVQTTYAAQKTVRAHQQAESQLSSADKQKIEQEIRAQLKWPQTARFSEWATTQVDSERRQGTVTVSAMNAYGNKRAEQMWIWNLYSNGKTYMTPYESVEEAIDKMNLFRP